MAVQSTKPDLSGSTDESHASTTSGSGGGPSSRSQSEPLLQQPSREALPGSGIEEGVVQDPLSANRLAAELQRRAGRIGDAVEPPEGVVAPLEVESLAAWHLPQLGDPAFVPLQPLLQRCVLLQSVLLNLPERLLHLFSGRPVGGARVLVARRGSSAQGLIVTRQINRRGSCWQVQHLRLASAAERRNLSQRLLREAIQRTEAATSWIATSSSLDRDRLAALREQGFQPLRMERLWRWHQPAGPAEAGGEPMLQPLSRANVRALLQLEQAACPAQLRQLLDRCSDDLLDQSRGRGWLLIDRCRNQAVAAVRWIGDHPGGGHDLELTVHPGWSHLIGSGTELLLQQAQQTLGRDQPLWLRSDTHDTQLERWLQQRGAEPRGERLLMARSVWRRQELPAQASRTSRRIEAVLEQLQPRRRPMPTPLGGPR
jgi:hypothetical protein